jgi:phosphoenolpyruvate---glycerone phosphotransferase subunit DhaM
LSNSVRHCRITAVEGNSRPSVVIVSHSAAIAAGLAELAGQVAGPDVSIVTAGGTIDGSLGTDGGRVLTLLRDAAADGGAVVLVDLGSSVLSVRAALAELDDAELERISVADAPLVEGAVAAAVALSTGCSHSEAARAAEEARGVGKL